MNRPQLMMFWTYSSPGAVVNATNRSISSSDSRCSGELSRARMSALKRVVFLSCSRRIVFRSRIVPARSFRPTSVMVSRPSSTVTSPSTSAKSFAGRISIDLEIEVVRETGQVLLTLVRIDENEEAHHLAGRCFGIWCWHRLSGLPPASS